MAKLTWTVRNGRLGDDPEIDYLEDNRCMARLSIAANRYKKDDDGEWEEVGITTWINAVAFGYPAEVIEAMELEKGDKVYAEGIMYMAEYEVEEEGEVWIEEGMNYYIDQIFRIPQVFEEEDSGRRKKKGKRRKKKRKRLKKKKGSKSKKKKPRIPGRKSKKKGKKSSSLSDKIMKQLGK